MTAVLRRLGQVDYAETWLAMKKFNEHRTRYTPDEVWVCEHFPVYTQGLSGRAEHILSELSFAVISTDRGGQITFHGLGQIVVYPLLDLRRKPKGIEGPRSFVTYLEQALIDLLFEYGIVGERLSGAPGVYVSGRKIASLGLRIKSGCCYHGLALNVDMDLTPFQSINPCGLAKMMVTDMVTEANKKLELVTIENQLIDILNF